MRENQDARRGTLRWFYDGYLCDEETVLVIASGTKLQVAYDYDGQAYRWSGAEEGEGHYNLNCPSISGEATLHCFPNDRSRYVGSWSLRDSDGYSEGLWQLEIE